MLLFHADGRPFASGAADYFYQPATGDLTPRIILQVEIEGVLTSAIFDTGAPYLICSPKLARYLNLDRRSALEITRLNIRGVILAGRLHRVALVIPASEGDGIRLDATAFVPEETSHVDWGGLPSFIGLNGCLERIRFAVDPGEDRLDFGLLTDD